MLERARGRHQLFLLMALHKARARTVSLAPTAGATKRGIDTSFSYELSNSQSEQATSWLHPTCFWCQERPDAFFDFSTPV
jgi:hypothetical protein